MGGLRAPPNARIEAVIFKELSFIDLCEFEFFFEGKKKKFLILFVEYPSRVRDVLCARAF